MRKCKFPELKAEIRKNEEDSRAIRKLINGSSGLDRWNHWDAKRKLGYQTRCLLLLYAMLRGVPYKVLEAKCDRYVLLWNVFGDIVKAAEVRGFALGKDEIKAWLLAEPAEVAA